MMPVESAQKNAKEVDVSIFHFAGLGKDLFEYGNDLKLRDDIC